MSKLTIIKTLKQYSQHIGLEWNGPTPLYHKLYSLLKDQIVDGTISYGAQLPTEQELGEAFKLSRITVKRAMDELAAEKLVERRRGRGTSVTYKYKPKPAKSPLVGLLENIETMGRHTLSRTIEISQTVPPADIREALDLKDGETACRLLRVRLTEDEKVPYAYYISWTLTPASTFNAEALNNHTRIELLRQIGIDISRIDQIISAEVASPEVARELNIREGSPLLVLERRSYDSNDKLVDILYCRYNPSIFQYQMTMDLDGYKENAQ
ncbi:MULTISPECIES: GntR family transcriptional regulator [Alteromonadaceae]|uniref:GntR family transcriptional regulator n=1 Tax=Alteromonadaceae TaxID=72275 RepID=UPI002090407E|nr:MULTISPECIES: GntR family transcriptional regulator [Aliiglaciecola]MDO6710742.1 GntR family transcriptional regulator [Aliiglaciecola sp. 2_MG-2023]MDO6751850.1 GntR family transcriptional regulator [Aliiglaciecola sp. 1_MG-2023]